MKKAYVTVLWVVLIILMGIVFFIMTSCAPVKMISSVSCLNSEWIDPHEAIRQRNEKSGQRIKARIEKYGYQDPMKIQMLPSGLPGDQSSWTFYTPQGTVFIK